MQLEHGLVTVAVVERFKKESMYGLSAGTKKVAVVIKGGRWWAFDYI